MSTPSIWKWTRPTSTHSSRGALSRPTSAASICEDIKAPDCFVIEERLRELMDIPVFHDDQHGTAIISAAGIINALQSDRPQNRNHQGRRERAGAAGIACLELLNPWGCRTGTRFSATPKVSSFAAAPAE